MDTQVFATELSNPDFPGYAISCGGAGKSDWCEETCYRRYRD
ncbi:MAG: hypothetical protein C5S49_03790 [Candidatus Methanogaster sp.]|nr:MAG: hypothetical protein C5S49_03790 [ANME-2 cluster archaeon]